MKMNRKLMKRTVTISNKHLQEIFYSHNLPETAETSVTNEMGLKNWKSSTETTETMKHNGKVKKQTVTKSNKHLQEIFYRHNLPETAETSVTNETGLKKWTSSTETTETMKTNRKLMKQTVTRSNKHLPEIFYRHNLPETAETSVTNETDLKNWTSSLETTETMKMNRKLMKRTVTISNKHLQEIFYRHNLPETAETSVTNETDLKKFDIFP